MRQLVKKVQDAMVESTFEEKQRSHLRTLIRLTVEFYAFLNPGDPEACEFAGPIQIHDVPVGFDPEGFELQYSIESILSGVESFCIVNAGYKVLVGAMPTTIAWNQVSALTLKHQFIEMFDEFVAEEAFERKCRLLLDLFKLQIVYAGMFYN